MEGIVLIKLTHLQLGCAMPLVIAMKLIKAIVITSRNLDTIHVVVACLVGSELRLIHHA